MKYRDPATNTSQQAGPRRETSSARTVASLFASVAAAAVLFAGSWSVLSAGDGVFGTANFSLDVTPETAQACPSSNALYLVSVGSIMGFSDPVTLTAVGTPAGTTTSFDVNPVTPPGSSNLTVGVGDGVTAGLYEFEVIGFAPTSTQSNVVFLDVLWSLPGAVTLVSPANGSIDQLQAPRMEWTPASDTVAYELQISTDPGFTAVVYAETTEGIIHTPSITLDPTRLHYWRVRAANPCGVGAYSAAGSFTTGAPGAVLLVDDDDENPDVRGPYIATMNGMGLSYDVYDTRNTDDEPSQALLDLYDGVIWFSGAAFTSPAFLGVAGPGDVGEGALAGYLDGGGCLILSSQDYLWDHGLTPFGTSYLGIGSFTSDVAQTTVTGQGPVFSGLGPYVLSFGFNNFSDQVVPANPAWLAFTGDVGDAGVTRADATYRTVFLGFPLEALPAPQDREDVLMRAFATCGLVFSDGFESGNVSRWSASTL